MIDEEVIFFDDNEIPTDVDVFIEGKKVPKKRDLINELTTEINGKLVYCNDLSLQRLMLAKAALAVSGESTITWLTVDKLPITLTIPDIDTIIATGVF